MDCKNCHAILKDTDDFCNICGAKIIRNRLAIQPEWFEQMIEAQRVVRELSGN